MLYFRKQVAIILFLILLIPSTISFADAGSRTTANLCRNCHGDNFGAYATLSQLSVPAEVGIGEVFTVSVRLVLSGNLDQSQPDYWKIDNEVTLSSAQNLFTYSPATYTYNDKLPGDIVDITWQLTADQGTGTDTLTTSVYSIAQHFSRTGSDQLSSGISVMPPNNPPQLSQPTFSPTQGDVNQLFDFEVIWSDVDGDMPSYLRLIVDGISLPLSEFNPGVENPVTGVRFVSSSMTLGAGYHTYFFQGSDGEAGVRLPLGDEVTQGPNGPLTGVYAGPFVGVPPTLENASLSPIVGDVDTDFTYSITLPQGDDMNNTQVIFWLDGAGSGIQPVVVDMGSAGWRFDFTTHLVAGVTHFHHFTATNTFGSIRYPAGSESLAGPILVGDVLSAASLSPTQGDERTLYQFSINYSNPAAIAPSAIAVVIDGNPLLLNSTLATPDWSNPTQFTVETLLAVGNHSYHFEAFEGGRSHRVPDSGELQLTVTRFDSPPWLNEPKVFVNGKEIFNQSSIVLINESANASRPIFLTNTEVEVRITFNDAEGDEALTGSLIAWIDGTPNLMMRLDGNNSTTGQTWGFNTTTLEVGENHTVYFTATSAYIPAGQFEGEKLRFPVSQNMTVPLPAIEAPPPPNVPPILIPPKDGRLMLNPFAGAESDNYTFLVEAVDADWTPEIQFQVWLELDGEIYLLQPVNASDHRNGTVFGITLQLAAGEHLHRFQVSDGEDEASYPESDLINGPTVQANMIPVEELANRPIFVSGAWWLVLANVLLIFIGVGWAVRTFRDARKVVYQREVRKMAKIFRDFEEESEREKEISNEEIADEAWRTRPPESYYEGGYVNSPVNSNSLLSQLGGTPRKQSSCDNTDDLLAELGGSPKKQQIVDKSDDLLAELGAGINKPTKQKTITRQRGTTKKRTTQGKRDANKRAVNSKPDFDDDPYGLFAELEGEGRDDRAESKLDALLNDLE